MLEGLFFVSLIAKSISVKVGALNNSKKRKTTPSIYKTGVFVADFAYKRAKTAYNRLFMPIFLVSIRCK